MTLERAHLPLQVDRGGVSRLDLERVAEGGGSGGRPARRELASCESDKRFRLWCRGLQRCSRLAVCESRPEALERHVRCCAVIKVVRFGRRELCARRVASARDHAHA
jgi:hypothetical protein